MNRDIFLLGITRVIRSFSFGYIAFLLPLYLKAMGFSVELIGLYALVATISSSILVIISGFLGDIYSRKKTLLIMSALPIFAMIILISTKSIPLLFASSVFGLTFAAMGGGAGGGPIAPLQTAMVASRVKEGRTKVYSYLTTAATFSAIAGGFFSSYVIQTVKDYYHVLFTLALALMTASLIAVALISEEPDKVPNVVKRSVLPKKSARNITKVAVSGMFGSLGLGMILPLLPIYFKDIGANDFTISLIYDASYIVAGISVLFASKVEKIFGTVNGIFIFRSLGTLPLILIPFFHDIAIAGAIYVMRTGFYQLALPMRQNLSMDLYSPEERSRGLSFTGVARRLPYGVASVVGSTLLALGLYVLLFSISGFIAFLDPMLYYIFFREYNKPSRSVEKEKHVDVG
ncbi:MAG: MFS transporter [Sulfolobaceae archaeon]|nr:MFS transporter [Sulfolobaceae archaeon]